MSFPEYHLIWLLCKNGQARVRLHLMLFLQTRALGKCTRISIIDSTPKLFNSKFAIHIANLEIWVKEYYVVTSCL